MGCDIPGTNFNTLHQDEFGKWWCTVGPPVLMSNSLEGIKAYIAKYHRMQKWVIEKVDSKYAYEARPAE